MDEQLKEALNTLFTISTLLEDHKCKENKLDKFPFPVCKSCHAKVMADNVISKYDQDGS